VTVLFVVKIIRPDLAGDLLIAGPFETEQEAQAFADAPKTGAYAQAECYVEGVLRPEPILKETATP
jgi:hypothetical protein